MRGKDFLYQESKNWISTWAKTKFFHNFPIFFTIVQKGETRSSALLWDPYNNQALTHAKRKIIK